MSRVRDQSASLAGRMIAAAGVAVTYTRGGVSLEIDALPGAPGLEVVNAEGAVVRIDAMTYSILTADLAELGLPQREDTIADGARVFEVIDGSGSGAFEYEDDGGTMLRVFCKEIGS